MNDLERNSVTPRSRARWQTLMPTLAVLVCLVVAGKASAAPLGAPALLVFELARELRHDAPAVSLTNELRQRVNDSAEFALMSDNPSLVLTARAAGCEIKSMRPTSMSEASDRDFDRACMARVGKRLGVERVMWGYFFEKQGQLFVKLHLWQQGEDHVKMLPYREASRTLVADRLFRHVAQAGRVGDLRVTAGGALEEGDLYVEGETKPLAHFEPSGIELTLPRGPVALELRAAGKVRARGRGEVDAGEAREVRLEPVATPAPPPALRGPTARPLATMPAQETAHAWQQPVGYASLGLGAIMLGAGVFSSLRVRNLDDRGAGAGYEAYRTRAPGGQDPCDAASAGRPSPVAAAVSPQRFDDLCAQAATFRTLQYVFYGVGALSAAAGAYLVLAAPDKAAASATNATWRLRPAMGLSGGGVALDGRF